MALTGSFINMSYFLQQDPFALEAINRIRVQYGDNVSIREKAKILSKFGRSREIGSTNRATVMTLPTGILNETLLATNGIQYISSDNATDTEEMTVEGHTIDGSGNFTFVTQQVTLNGQTPVALTTPLARATRMFNANGTELVGTIYVFENNAVTAGVPNTASEVHLMIFAGKQQSEKCATTLSQEDYWIVTAVSATMFEKTTVAADLELEIKLKHKVFREQVLLSVSNTSGSFSHELKPYIIVPPNSDIRVTSLASGANTDIGARIEGYLAKIV